jgi:6-phosphogluconolactonase
MKKITNAAASTTVAQCPRHLEQSPIGFRLWGLCAFSLVLTLSCQPVPARVSFNLPISDGGLSGQPATQTPFVPSSTDDDSGTPVIPSGEDGGAVVPPGQEPPKGTPDAGASKDAGTALPDAGGDPADPSPQSKDFVFVGSSTDDKIYVFQLNRQTGALVAKGAYAGASRPTYVALSPSGRYAFAVNSIAAAAVTVFSVNADTGALSPIATTPTLGDNAAHIAVSPRKQNTVDMVVAHFADGKTTSLRFKPNAGTLVVVDTVTSGQNAHQAVFNGTGELVYVPHLGSNFVAQHTFGSDAKFAALSPATVSIDGPPAPQGPRHMAIHPNGKWAYVINQTGMTMTLLDVSSSGSLTARATVNTRAVGGPAAEQSASHVVVHPSGQWVFGANRGDDTLVTFAVDATGKLKAPKHVSTGGMSPRDFAIDADGKYLYVGNQKSGSVFGFAIDVTTGALTPLGKVADVPGPAFVGVFRVNP